jgi:hypothetical protein
MDEKPIAPGYNRETLTLLRRLKRWRKRDWIFYWTPLLSASAVIYLYLTALPPSISRSSYERIAAGMTEREVEQIIGTRPGGYELYCGPGKQLSKKWADPMRVTRWVNHYGILAMGYNVDGQVCSKRLEYHAVLVPERPELWPWWKRLLNRSIPKQQPEIVFISF